MYWRLSFMDNEVIKNIKTRRSIRAYLDKEVSDELIDKVTEAGTYAPSGMSRQSATIVVIKDKNTRDLISKMNAKVMGRDIDPYYGAPVIILVLADSNVNTWVEDGSLVLENMMLAANSLGLGTVWVHREKEMFDSEEGKELLAKWGLKTSLRGVGSIALGYPKVDGVLHPIKPDYIVKI